MPEDLDLDPRPLPPRDPQPAMSRGVLTLLAVLALVAAGVFYWLGMRSGRLSGAPAAAPASAPAPLAREASPPAPQNAPAPPPQLPELGASDPFVRVQLAPLSTDPSWVAWLFGKGLITRFVAAVLAVSEGKSPRTVLDYLPVSGVFGVRVEGNRMVVAPSSFSRYDGVARLLKSIDVDKARARWQLLHPLLERAWSEISPPGRELDAVVLAALDHLIATPIPPTELEVYNAEGLYRYVDPALEGLSPAQKHLVRMGANNLFEVRESLRRLRTVVTP